MSETDASIMRTPDGRMLVAVAACGLRRSETAWIGRDAGRLLISQDGITLVDADMSASEPGLSLLDAIPDAQSLMLAEVHEHGYVVHPDVRWIEA